MIDLFAEDVLPLKKAADLLPPLRDGKPPTWRTLLRWSQTGLNGVKLEVVRVGATLCTSREALQRFCESQTQVAGV